MCVGVRESAGSMTRLFAFDATSRSATPAAVPRSMTAMSPTVIWTSSEAHRAAFFVAVDGAPTCTARARGDSVGDGVDPGRHVEVEGIGRLVRRMVVDWEAQMRDVGLEHRHRTVVGREPAER